MIVISGASKGIGKYLLTRFVEDNINVLGLYNSTKPIEFQSYYHQVDIRDEEQIIQFTRDNNNLENLVLINCAGVNVNSFTHKFDFQEWKKVFEVNTHGTFLLIKNLLPIMREQSYGRIINISSVVPQIGTVGTSAYAASKSALWGMTKVVSNENARKGVTVNCLNLGYFNVGMIEEVPKNILDTIIESIPQKKLGDPENIYNAIIFLIQSEYITGTSIDINGGLY